MNGVEKRALLIQICQKELALDISEDAGENEDLAGHIAKYRRAVTNEGVSPDRGPEPWCADFVSWAYLQIQLPLGPFGHGYRSCAKMQEWCEASDEVIAFSPGVAVPQQGDIVLFFFF